jgi:hypothetical protein
MLIVYLLFIFIIYYLFFVVNFRIISFFICFTCDEMPPQYHFLLWFFSDRYFYAQNSTHKGNQDTLKSNEGTLQFLIFVGVIAIFGMYAQLKWFSAFPLIIWVLFLPLIIIEKLLTVLLSEMVLPSVMFV